ncbi:MAG TPA: POTRA domain-containing protein [Candidatus Sulfotelmatobacter sp.]|jgi:outer membrane protein assembly factor BamA|nr:POTRA domain-containing protein [Candidatus Sulfotelmatobacter sp.]
MRRLLLAAACVVLLTPLVTGQLCDSEYENQVIVKVRHVVFPGAPRVPQEERDQIAREVRRHFRNPCEDQKSWSQDAAEMASEIAREWYQDRGYFKVQTEAQAILIEARGSTRIVDLRLQGINKGQLYRTGRLHWSGMTVFREDELLRLIPTHSGDIFGRDKIANGLEAVRSLYASRGYVNFTCIPNTTFDEDNATINLNIQIEEGPQFHFRNFSVAGLDDQRLQRWQEAWKEQITGRVFTRDDLRTFLRQFFRPAYPNFDPVWATRLNYDEKNSAIDVSMTFYPKPSDEAMKVTPPPVR